MLRSWQIGVGQARTLWSYPTGAYGPRRSWPLDEIARRVGDRPGTDANFCLRVTRSPTGCGRPVREAVGAAARLHFGKATVSRDVAD